ncbi:MAG: MBL fold metallo-hydrolase [Bacillota bacterium]
MDIKWFGTASILLKEEDHTILFDPFLPMNKNLYQPPLDELAAPDNIFITHGHFDHLISVPAILKKGGATVYCSDTAAATLVREGVKPDRIAVIAPGDSFEIGPFKINVLRGKHIVFDRRLIARTFLNYRMLIYCENLKKILRESSRYPEGQTLIFQIDTKDRKILHLGSLNMDENEVCPRNIDLLTLPFQGRSDLDSYALQFVQKAEPKAIYLHHFDDSFPPISSAVDTGAFIRKAAGMFTGIKVIVPRHGEWITL